MSRAEQQEVATQLLTYAQASRLLNVKVNTLYAWVARKVIPFVRLSRRVVRFRRDEIESWMAERSVRPVSQCVDK